MAASYSLQSSQFEGSEACLALGWQLTEAMEGAFSFEPSGEQDASLRIILPMSLPSSNEKGEGAGPALVCQRPDLARQN